MRIVAVNDGVAGERPDTLATEEPMEIRAAGPGPGAAAGRGHDAHARRRLRARRGVPVHGRADPARRREARRVLRRPAAARTSATTSSPCGWSVRSTATGCSGTSTRPPRAASAGRRRSTTSRCGASRSAPVRRCPRTSSRPLPDTLRSGQTLFDRTGGLHAAGLFTAEGELVSIREDVGRHNAVDKVIGEQLLAGHLPLAGHILQVSGRVSFEIVQKAAVAGIPIVSAVSAPTSLAVEAGDRFGMTIVGFVRDGRLNVYTGSARVGLNRRPRAGRRRGSANRGSRTSEGSDPGRSDADDRCPPTASRTGSRRTATRGSTPNPRRASVRSGRRRGDP